MARKPRQARSRATVNAIVEAAFIAVARHGPAAATTRQIADIAGIGVGSLYEYFSNKEAIFAAMSERFVSDTVAMLQPRVPELVRKNIRDAVLDMLVLFREFLQENDELYLKCARHAFAMDFEEYLDPVHRLLLDIVTQHMMRHPETARVRNIPAMTYIYINGGIFSVVRHLSEQNPPVTFEELSRGLADMVGHYVDQELLLTQQ
ncbi:TetR/AcrR family transcriptional regulator [Alcanivorax sp. JB21]|uniref:TetR/AcrR family transcriptional regulator n=1 Tax=Alcanivorax limicola TaxID=2874102 RepID=UPI001CBCA36D|nr:TetR/AcrR family transcriptional regulator [Alcanivorax limicola]MBZ2190133.1 TetR/AcrR family transcriptional regulator [Alcanivorax limicola]